MTAKELSDLLLKVPDAEVMIAQEAHFGRDDDVTFEPTQISFNPEANAWIIEP